VTTGRRSVNRSAAQCRRDRWEPGAAERANVTQRWALAALGATDPSVAAGRLICRQTPLVFCLVLSG
jgi:hypothetical protein